MNICFQNVPIVVGVVVAVVSVVAAAAFYFTSSKKKKRAGPVTLKDPNVKYKFKLVDKEVSSPIGSKLNNFT